MAQPKRKKYNPVIPDKKKHNRKQLFRSLFPSSFFCSIVPVSRLPFLYIYMYIYIYTIYTYTYIYIGWYFKQCI
ncbi:hypothetical protein CLU79DRAFT_762947 [Phycomyces nitens]|nr:hypothetical protein CLU79DRAFT_762947 [Phycomyces nitens]